jgi:putative stress-induced transcription regulator
MSTGKPVRIRTMSDPASSRALRNLVVVPRRDLSLDFANTVIWRGSAREESLHSLSDLLKWLTSERHGKCAQRRRTPKVVRCTSCDRGLGFRRPDRTP